MTVSTDLPSTDDRSAFFRRGVQMSRFERVLFLRGPLYTGDTDFFRLDDYAFFSIGLRFEASGKRQKRLIFQRPSKRTLYSGSLQMCRTPPPLSLLVKISWLGCCIRYVLYSTSCALSGLTTKILSVFQGLRKQPVIQWAAPSCRVQIGLFLPLGSPY